MLKILVVLMAIFTITTVQATSLEEWRDDELCGEKSSDFQTATLAECRYASCATLADKTQICACGKVKPNAKDAEFDLITTIERINTDGKRTVLMETEFFPFTYENNAVLLHNVRLAGAETDKKQLLLGLMSSQSNGIGIEFWQVWAISDQHVSKPVTVQDYGALGFATHAKHEKDCSLLVSQLLNGWEPKRGDGWYVAGHWYNLYDGEFFPDSRPTIYHRLLNSFAEKRGLALFEMKRGQQPFLWYKEKGTQTLIGPDVFRYHDIFSPYP